MSYTLSLSGVIIHSSGHRYCAAHAGILLEAVHNLLAADLPVLHVLEALGNSLQPAGPNLQRVRFDTACYNQVRQLLKELPHVLAVLWHGRVELEEKELLAVTRV